jgi:tRNA A-37 threonylcarbamoyl transferase component Bud32
MLLEPHGRALVVGDETALIARVAVHVAQALDGCHSLGVAHRDVTPTNFIVHDGSGYLIDFSVAEVRALLDCCCYSAAQCWRSVCDRMVLR